MVALAALCVVAITVLALVRAGRAPWLAVGWLWFLVGLVPVLGLVQAGDQSHADRYTYLPGIGLTMALVWEVAELSTARPRLRRALAAATLLLVALCAAGTRREIRWWRDTPTLFGHVVALQPDNYVGHLNLATWLGREGRLEEAMPHLRRCLALRPQLPLARVNLGIVLRRLGELSGAEAELRRAVRLAPTMVAAHLELAHVYADEGKYGLAVGHLAEVLGRSPGHPGALRGLRWLLGRPGAAAQAAPYVDAVARRHPASAELQRLASALKRRPAPGASGPAPPAPGRR
jgi:Tfp pilus assembly protein PilF